MEPLIAYLLLLTMAGIPLYSLVKGLLWLPPKWPETIGIEIVLGIVGMGALLGTEHPHPLLGIGDLPPVILWCTPMAMIFIVIGVLISMYPQVLRAIFLMAMGELICTKGFESFYGWLMNFGRDLDEPQREEEMGKDAYTPKFHQR